MTHKDIYTKFMIEYDKANVTSSYPSLTEYEVATFLDKAYNALIAQKVTGNNARRSIFESDVKSIADLSPLVVNSDQDYTKPTTETYTEFPCSNSIKADVPEDMLYILQAHMWYAPKNKYTPYPMCELSDYDPADDNGEWNRSLPIKLVDHNTASKFFASASNMPWVKEPVCYIENGTIYVIHDSLNIPNPDAANKVINVVYIKKPNTFVKDLTTPKKYANGFASYFDFNEGTSEGVNDILPRQYTVSKDDYEFECNSTMAEELVSLAITFALENVESSRLNSKLNTRGLEA